MRTAGLLSDNLRTGGVLATDGSEKLNASFSGRFEHDILSQQDAVEETSGFYLFNWVFAAMLLVYALHFRQRIRNCLRVFQQRIANKMHIFLLRIFLARDQHDGPQRRTDEGEQDCAVKLQGSQAWISSGSLAVPARDEDAATYHA